MQRRDPQFCSGKVARKFLSGAAEWKRLLGCLNSKLITYLYESYFIALLNYYVENLFREVAFRTFARERRKFRWWRPYQIKWFSATNFVVLIKFGNIFYERSSFFSSILSICPNITFLEIFCCKYKNFLQLRRGAIRTRARPNTTNSTVLAWKSDSLDHPDYFWGYLFILFGYLLLKLRRVFGPYSRKATQKGYYYFFTKSYT